MRGVLGVLAVCLLVRVELSSGQCRSDYEFVGDKCFQYFDQPLSRDQAEATCTSVSGRLLSPVTQNLQSETERALLARKPDWLYTWTSAKESTTNWRWLSSNTPVQPSLPSPNCYPRTQRATASLYEVTFGNIHNITTDSCLDMCKKWLANNVDNGIAAVTSIPCRNSNPNICDSQGRQSVCYCGQNNIAAGQATCDFPCPANSLKNCGGQNAYAVYRLNVNPQGIDWAANQPATRDGNEFCMALGFGEAFQWIAKQCSTKMRYVCQYDLPQGSCDQGKKWYSDADLCYSVSQDALTFYEARDRCQQQRGILATAPVSENFRTTFIDEGGYRGTVDGATWDFYTGATKSKLNWGDGTPVTYTNFAPRQPNYASGSCIVLSKQATTPYQWDSRQCSDQLPFVCEMPASTVTTTPSTTTTTTTPTTTTTTPTTTTTTVAPTTTSTPSTAATRPTPAPATPAPATPAPATPAPATPAPVTPAPATPTPATPAPATPAPTTPARTPAPTTAKPTPTRRTPRPTPSTAKPSRPTPPKPTPRPTQPPVKPTKGTTPRSPNQLPAAGGGGAVTSLDNLPLGTKVTIGIVASVVVVSLIILIVFIVQRRRKDKYEDDEEYEYDEKLG